MTKEERLRIAFKEILQFRLELEETLEYMVEELLKEVFKI